MPLEFGGSSHLISVVELRVFRRPFSPQVTLHSLQQLFCSHTSAGKKVSLSRQPLVQKYRFATYICKPPSEVFAWPSFGIYKVLELVSNLLNVILTASRVRSCWKHICSPMNVSAVDDPDERLTISSKQ
jgi:hypothetical protein